MNNHISKCHSGNSSCIFPTHVSNCAIKHKKPLNKPFFKIYKMQSLNDASRLDILESHYHNKGYDTLNNPKRTDMFN